MKPNPIIQSCLQACADWGLIPTEFKQCMTWEEQVLWLFKFLNTTVIPAVNTDIENVNTLAAEFAQLQAYVEDYFDNLDVQEEIDNKLDEMATSGQLQQLIDAYFAEVDAKIAEQNAEITDFENRVEGKIQEQDADIETFKTGVNTRLSSQDTSINSLTSRMDDFSSLTEGSTTGDAELIDGRTSFDGRTFTNIGGNIRYYQGAGYNSIIENCTLVEGKYRNATMVETTNASYNYYKVQTEKGKYYFIDTTTADSVAQVVISVNNKIPASTPSGSGTHSGVIVIEGNGGIFYVNASSSDSHVFIGETINPANTSELSKYFKDITETATVTEGKFRNKNGGESNLAAGKYYTITPTAGKIYRVFTAIITNMAAIVKADGAIIPVPVTDIPSHNTPTYYDILATSTDTIYFNASTTEMGENQVKIYESIENYGQTTSFPSKSELTVGSFDKAVFIGDSLTYGQTYVGGAAGSYRNYYNYPYFAKKLMQINETKVLARSGATSSSWWSEFESQITDDDAIYFVWLGTNDTFTDTVATDCAGDDYTQFSDNETGNFGKIIGKIAAHSNVKIVMLNTLYPSNKVATNNKVISDLATKYGALLVDVNQNIAKQEGYHTAYNGNYNQVHFNSNGYALIANMVKESLDTYMKNNPGEFEFYKVAE